MSKTAVKPTIRRRNTPVKQRSQSCYNRKVEEVKKWHRSLEVYREKNPAAENKNNKMIAIRKQLKPIDWYIEKIKKPK